VPDQRRAASEKELRSGSPSGSPPLVWLLEPVQFLPAEDGIYDNCDQKDGSENVHEGTKQIRRISRQSLKALSHFITERRHN
jgi:hypothetical protein